MLKRPSAMMKPASIFRLVALIIVASTIVGISMITAVGAASGESVDQSVNVIPIIAVFVSEQEATSPTTPVVEQVEMKTFRSREKDSHYITTEVDLSLNTLLVKASLPTDIKLENHAANNTDDSTTASKIPTVMTADITLPTHAAPEGFVYIPDLPLSKELQLHSYKQAVEHDLTYTVVLALMWRESRFSVSAVGYNTNGTRDTGLMQINDVNKGWLYQELGISNLFDPVQNINAGTEMLGRMRAKHGMHNALLAYQYGEAGMLKKVNQGVTTNNLVEQLYKKSSEFEQLFEQYKMQAVVFK